MSSEFAPIHVIMLLALLEYFAFLLFVGSARYRFGVKAPAVSGNADFERYYRVQMNTLEVLVIFLPALWSFALFISIRWAALLGALFIIGRAVYFIGYTRAAEKRSLGFGLSSLPMIVLLIGGLLGAGQAWLG